MTTSIARLHQAATELDAAASTHTNQPAEHIAYERQRTLARRCDLGAFVTESQQLVDAITTDLTLLAERHAQVFTGRLVGEYEREQLDSVMARVHQLRFELAEHWPRLRTSVDRILDQADEELALVR